jgi:hypothetical protein
MATITLTDDLGLDADVTLAPFSSLLKYFQQLPVLRLSNGDFSKTAGLTLDQPALTMLNSGLSFADSVSIRTWRNRSLHFGWLARIAGTDYTNAGGSESTRRVCRRNPDRGWNLLRRLGCAGVSGRFGWTGCWAAAIRSGPGPNRRHPKLSEFSAEARDYASRPCRANRRKFHYSRQHRRPKLAAGGLRGHGDGNRVPKALRDGESARCHQSAGFGGASGAAARLVGDCRRRGAGRGRPRAEVYISNLLPKAGLGTRAAFARTVTAHRPFNSPLSGCNRKPGISISATVRAASSLARMSRSF